MSTITKSQATREINRRKGVLPKGVSVPEARAKANAEGTFGLDGPTLREIAGRAKAQVAKAKKAAPAKAEEPTTVDPLEHVRVLANEEFRVAKETGGVKAGFAARKAFCEALKALV